MSRFIGNVSAYAYAVSKGYTGTEEEFAELMADYAEVGQRAEDAAESALNSKTAAQTAAQTATTKAGEAQTSAQTASSKASEASQSASQASGYAQTAETAKTDAQTAKTQADTARDEAVTAKTAAETAQGKAEDAQEAAETTAQSISASAVQIATNTADITQLKSEVSALPTDGVVGNSKQLLSENGTDNTEPYMFRAVPVNADRAELDAVIGGTVAWNQLIPNVEYTETNNGVTVTSDSNGLITLSGTSTKESGYINFYITGKGSKLLDGHAYLFNIGPKVDTGTTNMSAVVLLTGNGGLLTCYNKNGTVVKQSGAPTGASAFYVRPSYTFDGTFAFYCGVIDLTQLFGSTIADYIYQLEQSTAGAGVAFFRKLFPKDYYPYDAGTLKSVEGVSGHETVGFNQWDEEWEVGQYDPATGNPMSASNAIRSKNLIHVFSGMTYYLKMPAGTSGRLFYYDANKEMVSTVGATPDRTFVVPSNAHYMKFHTSTGYGAHYNYDICINFSDPAHNGEYEPYEEHSYPLDSNVTLRGITKLDANNNLYYDGDEYASDGKVTRQYREVVFDGTENWGVEASSWNSHGLNAFYTILREGNNGYFPGASFMPMLICDKFVSASTTLLKASDKTGLIGLVGGSGSANYIEILSDATDVASFKTWLANNNTKVVYKLLTPTTENATPYQSLQVCDPNGTEEFVSTGIVPVGHETRYPENLRAKIEGLPWDFSSLIAPTEKTATASRNYTTGSLLIMGNVLYKVTANIASGGTITPNTNVTATTLSEILSVLAQ